MSAEHLVYIALGSNLHQPLKQLQQAIEALNNLPTSSLLRVSSPYQSLPMGEVAQPRYLNAVACLQTQLNPLALLDALQHIERQQGRERLIHWGPRTLDLDILLYDDQHISTTRLTVPHYGMRERNFVLLPLAEIAPNLQFSDGVWLRTLIENLDCAGLHKLSRQLFEFEDKPNLEA